MTSPKWKSVEPLCWFNRTNKWRGGGRERKKNYKISFPSLPSSLSPDDNNMGAKLLKENAAAPQANSNIQDEEHGKKFIKYIRSAKLHLKVTLFLYYRHILRERDGQCVHTDIVRPLKQFQWFYYYYFIKHNKVVQIYETVSMLMRKTFRWHAVIHVRTYGHPISNLADFEKERWKSWRNAHAWTSDHAPRQGTTENGDGFLTRILKRRNWRLRGTIASDTEIKRFLNERRKTSTKVITPTNHNWAK